VNADIFTLCDFAQESDGKMTVVGAFDTIYAKQFPAVHPFMCLALRLRFFIHESGSHAMRISFSGPEGRDVAGPIEGQLAVGDFAGSSRVVHSVFTFVNTPMEREGTVGITLSVDGREVLSSPLYVRKA
jgi:hypothetical protein